MVIALYGGVGSGKSEVLKILQNKYGAEIFSADREAKKVYIKGNKGHEEIAELLGDDIISDSGIKDVDKYSELLFNNSVLREKVNNIIHPAVYGEMKSFIRLYGQEKLIVIESAVLPDIKPDFIDHIWYVYTSPEERITRLMSSRCYSEEKARSIMDSQLSDDEYRKRSDLVINNTGNLYDLEKGTDEAIKHCQWQQR